MNMPTPTDRVLDKLDELSDAQSRQGEDVAVIKSSLPGLSTQLLDHERRLRSLEARLWYALGALALIAFALPVVIKLLP